LLLGGMCTRVCVPVVFVMRAVLFAHELLVHDFFELDHFDGCGIGICVDVAFAGVYGFDGVETLVVVGLLCGMPKVL
jgi:hypothetical protein